MRVRRGDRKVRRSSSRSCALGGQPDDPPEGRDGACKQGARADQTAELAIDDLGLDLGALDTVDQPGSLGRLDAGRAHPGRGPGRSLTPHHGGRAAARRRAKTRSPPTGAWQFDRERARCGARQTDARSRRRLGRRATARAERRRLDVHCRAMHGHRRRRMSTLDLDVGMATGTHAPTAVRSTSMSGTATVPDAAFTATQKLVLRGSRAAGPRAGDHERGRHQARPGSRLHGHGRSGRCAQHPRGSAAPKARWRRSRKRSG